MVTAYDAIVIGTGQAGPPLAVRLADAGMKVAIIERKRFGGTCVNNNGCIPTKTLVANARAAHMMYAKAPYTVIQRAMHIHPTVTELISTMLGDLEPLEAKNG